jgi:hypothetical protein
MNALKEYKIKKKIYVSHQKEPEEELEVLKNLEFYHLNKVII